MHVCVYLNTYIYIYSLSLVYPPISGGVYIYIYRHVFSPVYPPEQSLYPSYYIIIKVLSLLMILPYYIGMHIPYIQVTSHYAIIPVNNPPILYWMYIGMHIPYIQVIPSY